MRVTLANSLEGFKNHLRSLTHIIVVDLEATCGDNVPREHMEAIQYGAVTVRLDDLSNERLRQFEVRPVLNPVLSMFCTSLTGISQEMVNAGLTYDQALEIVRGDVAGLGEDWAWCSWGEYDRNQMDRDSLLHRLPPWLPDNRHFNLKSLHGMVRGIKRGNGLAKATALEGMKFEGVHHNALSDALTAANILKKLIREFRE